MYALHAAKDVILDAISKVRKCNDNGRTQMSLDVSGFQTRIRQLLIQSLSSGN